MRKLIKLMLNEKFPGGHGKPSKGVCKLCLLRELRHITFRSQLLGLTYYQIYIGGNFILPVSTEREFILSCDLNWPIEAAFPK